VAIAIDASSPALVLAQNAAGEPAVTASFTPPLNQTVLVAVVMSNATTGVNPVITMANSGAALTWTEKVRRAFGDSGAQDGATIIYTAPLDSSRSLTVSVSNDQTGDFGAIALDVYVVTGVNTAAPVGAVSEGSSTTSNITPTVITTTVDGSWTIGGASDWAGSGVPTSSDTGAGFNDATSGVLSGIAVRKSAASSGVGTSVTLNFNGGASTRQWNYAAVEIMPALAASLGPPLVIAPPGLAGPFKFRSPIVRARYAAPNKYPAARLPQSYFVSAAGSDAADGKTSSTPWLTIAHVNTVALQPGDSVSFRGGDTFTGNVAPTTSGTATLPIVYKSYGTGNATISATTTDAFSFVNVGGFEVRNLTLVGGATSFSNGSAGVNGYATAGNGKRSYLLVDSCDISGFQHGVIVGGDTTSEGFDSITVTNNVCHGNKNDGVALWGGAGGTAFSNSNATITNNVCNANLGDSADVNPTGHGIVVGSTNTCLIDLCTAHDNGGSNNAAGGPVGIWCYDSTAVTIQRCLSYSNKTAGATDGGGFDLDINTSNSVIQYCFAYNNDGPGFMCFASGTSVFTGNTVRYNIGWGNVRNVSLPATTYGEMLVAGTVASTNIYGNTFYAKDNASNNISAFIINATPTGVTVRNNIFQSQAAVTVLADTAWTTGQAFMQGNDYYRASGTQIKWGATTYTTLAAWRAVVTGQEQVSAVNTGFTVDPVFSSPTTTPIATDATTMTSVYTGLQLSTSSTLKAAGLDLNGTFGTNTGTRDFWNITLTVPLSVGAHEQEATGPQTLTLTATIGFTGATSKLVSTHQLATLSFTGASSKRALHSLLASLAFVGAESERISSLQLAQLSFTGADSERISSGQLAHLSFTGTKNALTSTHQSAQLNFTGSATLRTIRLLTATLTFVGALTSAAVHHFTQALSATLGFTGSLVRGVHTSLPAASLAFVGLLSRAVGATRVSTLGYVGTLARRTSTTLPVAHASFTGSASLRTARLLSATLSFTGSLTASAVHFFTQALSATVGFTGSLARRAARTLTTAVVGFTGALPRRVGSTQNATVGFVTTQPRRVVSTQSAVVGFTGTTTRRLAKILAVAAGLTFTGALTQLRVLTKALAATISFTGSLTQARGYSRALAATVGFTATFARQTRKVNAAALSFTGTQVRRVRTSLSAALAFTTSFTIAPSLLSALSNLRVRIFGREPGGVVGREPPSRVSYKRGDGEQLSGREDGT
jgi:hypothetical protein